jgi:hypothetical protein
LAGCFYSQREQQGGMETAIIDETTRRYLGQWQRLVSTTNWDKGRILCAWRQSLQVSGAAAAEYSDEAWSRQVGNVTPQHVGRLRRTWERFGAVSNEYAGLYWSHFQAASDWPDAEMWLEGAVQSDWSVLQMRQQRATALGLVEADSGSADAGTPWDEDGEVPPAGTPSAAREAVVQDPGAGRGTQADEYDANESQRDSAEAGDWEEEGSADSRQRATHKPTPAAEPRRPLAELPSLPADVSEAFESFKLCILRHKLAGWSEISPADMLAALDALKELALAPPVE